MRNNAKGKCEITRIRRKKRESQMRNNANKAKKRERRMRNNVNKAKIQESLMRNNANKGEKTRKSYA